VSGAAGKNGNRRARCGVGIAVEPLNPDLDDFDAREDVRGRRRRALLGVTILTFGVGVLLLVPRDGPQAVATDAAAGAAGSQAPIPNAERPTSAPADELDEPTPFLTMEWMDVSGGPDGTERVVLVFDKDLPEVPVRFVDDVASPEPSAVSYTTQGPGDEGVRVCDGIHWFPGATKGSVDLLLPGNWFELGSESYLGHYRTDPEPVKRGTVSKIPICVTKNGFIQVSVWGPASDNPEDVTVSVEGNTITLDIEPPIDDLDEPMPSIAWQRVEATGGPDGTERVVLVFDNNLPKAPVVFVDDVTSPEPSAVSYTTQAAVPGGDGISVCDATHWFPNAGSTSVDVLLPSEWFAPGPEAYGFQGPVRIDPPGASIGKISACQYKGFVQFVVWGSASDNPEDVTVSVEGKTLTIEITPR